MICVCKNLSTSELNDKSESQKNTKATNSSFKLKIILEAESILIESIKDNFMSIELLLTLPKLNPTIHKINFKSSCEGNYSLLQVALILNINIDLTKKDPNKFMTESGSFFSINMHPRDFKRNKTDNK